MKNLQFILILFTVLSCSRERQKLKQESSFDLKRDIYSLSQKLNNGDTVFFQVALGVCISQCREYNTIFKKNDSILIQSTIVNIDPKNETKDLNSVLYIFNPNDTLNFENLFSSMKADIKDPKSIDGETIFEVRYHNDTLEYYPKNLVFVLSKISFYCKIKERLYPEENLFKPYLIYKPDSIEN